MMQNYLFYDLLMILVAKEIFLLEQARTQGATALYEAYLSIIGGTENLVCNKSIKFLETFVNYPPTTCIRIIRMKENDLFSLNSWGNDYLYLLTTIAAFYLDKGDIVQGLQWADKSIDLVDYFLPTLHHEVREEILYNLPASAMVCAFPKQYLRIPYDQFYLDWEIKRFCHSGNRIHYNDN
jgi:hypothetical protein